LSQNNFSSLPLHSLLLQNLESLNYHSMTAIQAQSLPHVLKNKDVIVQGKTGSGKTAVFGLGLLNKLDQKQFRIQSIVLCPTRELADQVAKEIRQLGRLIQNIKILTLCGGTPLHTQVNSLAHGVHIIVGTPGRIEDLLQKNKLNLDEITSLVLDEADKMLDMGFQPSIEKIIKYLPNKRQTLLFSATFPDEIKSIAKHVMNQPEHIQHELTHDNETIQQSFFSINNQINRTTALRLLLLHYQPTSAVVFCNTKKATTQLAKQLTNYGFSAIALNGDLEQRDRNQILVQFANQSISILVATDVAARGLDIDNLDAVINYEVSQDAEIHLHRIGRTGRAGKSGVACTLYSEDEHHKIIQLEIFLKQSIESSPLPAQDLLDNPSYQPRMCTIRIEAGKKQKLRPGDILGTLTSNKQIAAKEIGKITVTDKCTYVAVNRNIKSSALNTLKNGKIKGRSFRFKAINESPKVWP